MNAAQSLRRPSVMELGPGAAAPSSSSSTVAGAGTGSANRPSFLLTIGASSQQSRRPSMAVNNVAAPSVILSGAYENSYRVSPEKPFCAVAARRVLREVMEDMLDGRQYDHTHCRQLTTSLADAIKKRVKELGHPRYKLVTNVAIGQAQHASIAFSSRCVWNDSFDSFAEYTYQNGSLYAVGLVHALYCD